VKVVGVGCGPGMLTEEAIRTIAAATEIYGSRRAIELALHHISPGSRVHELADYRHLRDLPPRAVLLSTGDPMLAGLGMAGSEVVPGISSLQIAAARLRLPLARFSVVSAHGKDHAGAITEALGELARGRCIFLLSDPSFDPRVLSKAVDAGGDGYRIAVCERLGYPDERISVGTSRDPPSACSGLFVVVIWKDPE
jgi:cobalt-precorrin-7 (C5)-methyltransferase